MKNYGRGNEINSISPPQTYRILPFLYNTLKSMEVLLFPGRLLEVAEYRSIVNTERITGRSCTLFGAGTR